MPVVCIIWLFWSISRNWVPLSFMIFAGLDINPLSRAVRGKVFVAGEGKDKIKFGVAVRTDCTEGTETYDYNQTHYWY